MTETIQLVIQGEDRASGALRSVAGGLAGIAQYAIGGLLAQGIAGIGRSLREMAGDVIGTSADFESQMAIMSTAVSDTSMSMADMGDIALQVGGDTSLVGISASEAAEAITGLYKAGLDTVDIFGDVQGYMAGTTELSGALRAAVDLQAASEMDLAGASDLVSVAMATWGLGAEDATRIADNFVQAADASVADVQGLAEAMVNVGPTMAAFGIGLEDTNTALAILSTRGIEGAEAGTSFKSMLTNLMRPTEAVQAAFDELGVSLYSQSGQLRELPDIIGDLQGALGGLTEKQRNQYVQTLAGTYGMKALQTLVGEGLGGWRDMEAAIADASTAQEVAAARTDTYTGKSEALDGVIETLKIRIGGPFLDTLGDLKTTLADLITEHMPDITAAFGGMAGEIQTLAEQWLPVIVDWISSELVPALTEAWHWVQEEMVPALVEFWTTLQEDVLPVVKELWQQFVNNVLPALVDVATFVSENLDEVMAGLAAIVLTVVVPALISWAAAAISAAIATITALAPVLIPLALIGAAVGLLVYAWKEGWIQGIWETLKDVVAQVVDTVTGLYEQLVQIWNLLVERVQDTVWGLYTQLVQIWELLVQRVRALWGAVWDWARTKVRDAVRGILDAWDQGKQWLHDLMSRIVENIRDAWEAARDWVADIVRGIVERVREKFDEMVDAGRRLVDGIRTGISNAWNGFLDWLRGILSTAIDAVKSFFGISSPSQVFARFGEQMMEGLAVGIGAGVTVPVRALVDAGQEIVGTVDARVLAGSGAPGGGAFGGAVGSGGNSTTIYGDVSIRAESEEGRRMIEALMAA